MSCFIKVLSFVFHFPFQCGFPPGFPVSTLSTFLSNKHKQLQKQRNPVLMTMINDQHENLRNPNVFFLDSSSLSSFTFSSSMFSQTCSISSFFSRSMSSSFFSYSSSILKHLSSKEGSVTGQESCRGPASLGQTSLSTTIPFLLTMEIL